MITDCNLITTSTAQSNCNLINTVNTLSQSVPNNSQIPGIVGALGSEEDPVHNYIIQTNSDGTLQLIICPSVEISEAEHLEILKLLKEHNEQILLCNNQGISLSTNKEKIEQPRENVPDPGPDMQCFLQPREFQSTCSVDKLQKEEVPREVQNFITTTDEEYQNMQCFLQSTRYEPRYEHLGYPIDEVQLQNGQNSMLIDEEFIKLRTSSESVIKQAPKIAQPQIIQSEHAGETINEFGITHRNNHFNKLTDYQAELNNIFAENNFQVSDMNLHEPNLHSADMDNANFFTENQDHVFVPLVTNQGTLKNIIFKTPRHILSKEILQPTENLLETLTQSSIQTRNDVVKVTGIDHDNELLMPGSNIQCILCTEKFGSTTALKRHLKTHSIERRYKCSRCTATFTFENNLKVHIVNSHGSSSETGLNTCSICRKNFRRKASFLAHMWTHQTEEILTCEVCGGEYQNETALLKHLEFHSLAKLLSKAKDELSCPYCAFTFLNLAELKDHKRTHVYIKNILKTKKPKNKACNRLKDPKRFKCKACGKFFGKKSLLIRHMRIHTGEKPFLCSVCGKRFSQKGTLKLHSAHHLGGKPYSCTLCKARFLQKSNLKTHILRTHVTSKNSEYPVYQCMECPCVFKKVATLNGHITKVHRDPISKETEPNIVDQVMKNLKILGSSDGKNCDDSEKALENAGKMEIFEDLGNGIIKKHSVLTQMIDDIRYYICGICSRTFKKPSDLLRHNRKHTLERPFTCYLCKKGFSLQSSLKNHIKTHTPAILTMDGTKDFVKRRRGRYQRKEKPDITNEPSFNNSESSSSESRGNSESKSPVVEPIAPGEEKLHCPECKKKFFSELTLNRHYAMVHTTLKPYSCQFCDQDFTSYALCRSHLKSVHNMVDTGGVKTKLLEEIDKFVVQNSNSLLKDVQRDNVGTKNKQRKKPTKVSEEQQKQLLSGGQISNNPEEKPVHSEDKMLNNFQMVYLNLNTGQDGNNGFQTDPLLLNPLDTIVNNSTIVFDLNKSNSVNPTHAIEPGNGKNLVDIDVTKLPIQIIDNTASSHPHQALENEIPSDLFYNAQVICVNCHQIYSDMNCFQKHDCPNKFPNNSDADLLNYPIVTCDNANNVQVQSKNNETHIHENAVLTSECDNDLNNVVLAKSTNFKLNNDVQMDNHTLKPSECVDNIMLNNSTDYLKNSDFKLPEQSTTEKIANDTGTEKELRTIELSKEKPLINIDKLIEVDPSEFFNANDLMTNDFQRYKAVYFENKFKEDLVNNTIEKEGTNCNDLIVKNELSEMKTVKFSKQYECDVCGMPFRHEKSLKKHVSKMHKAYKLPAAGSDRTCTFCAKKFQKPSDLQRHLRTHTGERPFACDLCDKKFALKSTMELHGRTHTRYEPNVSCDICGAKFVSKATLKVHMNKHTGANPYPCNFCNEFFPTSSKRITHQKKVHIKIIDDDTRQEKKKKRKEKEETPAETNSKMLKMFAEQVTQNVKHDETAYEKKEELHVLQTSDQYFAQPQPLPIPEPVSLINQSAPMTLDELMLHIQSGAIVIAPNNGLIVVNDKGLGMGENLNFEQRNVNQQLVLDENQVLIPDSAQPNQTNAHGKVVCPICQKTYASKESLRKHKRNVHGQNKKFPCIKCDKTYATQDEMNIHFKSHAGVRPFHCKYCANSFMSEGHLKIHITRMHVDAALSHEANNALLSLQFDIQGNGMVNELV